MDKQKIIESMLGWLVAARDSSDNSDASLRTSAKTMYYEFSPYTELPDDLSEIKATLGLPDDTPEPLVGIIWDLQQRIEDLEGLIKNWLLEDGGLNKSKRRLSRLREEKDEQFREELDRLNAEFFKKVDEGVKRHREKARYVARVRVERSSGDILIGKDGCLFTTPFDKPPPTHSSVEAAITAIKDADNRLPHRATRLIENAGTGEIVRTFSPIEWECGQGEGFVA